MFKLNEMMIHTLAYTLQGAAHSARTNFFLKAIPNFGSRKTGKKTRVSQSCYMPHQGTQECARRVRQMEKAAMKASAQEAHYAV